MPSPDDLAYFVLQVLAWQDGRPLGREAIRHAVDFYERLVLTDAELDDALRRLAGAGHVITAAGCYALAPALVAILPRTRAGAVSAAAAPWRRLRARLAGAAAHDT